MSQPANRPAQKLCVCGRSKAFPICDNSHDDEDWTCAVGELWSKFGFSASYRYQNLARKLSSHYQAALLLPGESMPVVDTLVTIVDGTDLEFALAIQPEIKARQQLVVTLGTPGALLQPMFPDSRVVDMAGATVFEAFKRICAYLEDSSRFQGVDKLPSQSLKSAFISHAVKDEFLVAPVLDYLREYFRADIFVCVDSISPGVNWHATILTALQTRQLFVLLLSEATLASHFCSFEIGFAYALEKPMRLISLDGSRPPPFIQHLQTVDLSRIALQKPWLDRADILLDGLIQSLVDSP